MKVVNIANQGNNLKGGRAWRVEEDTSGETIPGKVVKVYAIQEGERPIEAGPPLKVQLVDMPDSGIEGGKIQPVYFVSGGPSGETVPIAPSNLVATTFDDDRIDLEWDDNSDNETGFNIYRDDVLVDTVVADETTYSNTGLEPDTTYEYHVTAVNGAGESAASNTDSATTDDVEPDAPSDLAAEAVSSTQINLSWTDNSDNETGFKIYRDTVLIDTIAADETTYEDIGLTPNTEYDYYVVATNAIGDSTQSNTATETTGVVLTLQPNAAAGKDTWITLAQQTFNYGVNNQLIAGRDSIDRPYRGLLQFDLSSIPGGATIVAATLTLYCVAELNTTDRDVAVYRGLVQWYEGAKDGVAPDAMQDGSTWLLRNPNGAVAWAGGAGGAEGSDWTAIETDSTSITGTGTAFDWDVTADVAAWVGGANNYGWWIRGDAELSSYKQFASSDSGTAAQRPKLTIEYVA